MTVVEAYVGRNKMHSPDYSSKLDPKVLALLYEGVAQNTTGNVFHPKVCVFTFNDGIWHALLCCDIWCKSNFPQV